MQFETVKITDEMLIEVYNVDTIEEAQELITNEELTQGCQCKRIYQNPFNQNDIKVIIERIYLKQIG